VTDGPRYWINTISLDHVEVGVAGGFTQADHGRNTRLRRLRHGDWIVFYSPRTTMKGGDPVQAFTAIGRIDDDEPYQVEMTPEFHPWRRRVEFAASHHADARPLVASLSFVTDEQRWGYPFRRGLFEVPAEDAATIADAMGADLDRP
jgi:hypothetical protein